MTPIEEMGNAMARYAIKAGYLEGAIKGVLEIHDPILMRQLLGRALERAEQYAAEPICALEASP